MRRRPLMYFKNKNKENCIIVTYQAYYTNRTEIVFNSEFDINQIVDMFIDDIKVEISKDVKFTTTGLHKIKYVFENLTSLRHLFYGISSPEFYIVDVDMSSLDASTVTDMYGMFNLENRITSIDMSNVDISNVTNMNFMFRFCTNLKSVTMTGNPSNLVSTTSMFDKVTTTGTFYYNKNYNYSKIIAVLPSTWTAVAI